MLRNTQRLKGKVSEKETGGNWPRGMHRSKRRGRHGSQSQGISGKRCNWQ